MSLVDIIIPVKNTPFHYLTNAIDSVLSQTVNDYQIVIVNDGSSGIYKKKLVKYISHLKSNRILLIHNSGESGPSAARNFGIRSSSSKYVTFLDSDDYWFPNKLEIQLKIMEDGNSYSLIHSDVEYINGNGSTIASTSSIPKQDFNILTGRDLIIYLINRNRIEILSVMVTRDSLIKTGCFDEHFLRVEDWDLWLRYAISGEPMYYHGKVLASYRKYQSSISHDYEIVHQFKEKLFQKTFQALEKSDRKPISELFKKNIFRKLYKLTGQRLYNVKNYKKALSYFKLSAQFGFEYDCLRRQLKCMLRLWILKV